MHTNSKKQCVLKCMAARLFFAFACVRARMPEQLGHMVHAADNPFQQLLRNERANRSIFSEGTREHSHGASLGNLAERRSRRKWPQRQVVEES